MKANPATNDVRPTSKAREKRPGDEVGFFFTQVIVKYIEKNLDITKLHYSEQILQFLGPLLYRGSTVIWKASDS